MAATGKICVMHDLADRPRMFAFCFRGVLVGLLLTRLTIAGITEGRRFWLSRRERFTGEESRLRTLFGRDLAARSREIMHWVRSRPNRTLAGSRFYVLEHVTDKSGRCR
jgi:hypothetical protein